MKKFILALAFSAAAAAAVSSKTADAQTFDLRCENALIPTRVLWQSDDRIRMSFLQIINRENFQSWKRQIGAGVSLPVDGIPFQGFANFDEFEQSRSREFNRTNFTLDESHSRNFVTSYVSDSALSAYTECLRLQARSMIGLQYIVRRVTDSTVSLDLFWNPPPQAGALGIRISNISGATTPSNFPSQINTNSFVPLDFVRVPRTAFDLTIDASGYQPVRVNVPLVAPVVARPPEPWEQANFQAAFGVLVHQTRVADIQGQAGAWVGHKGQGWRLEGMQIDRPTNVPNLSVQYMCHVQGTGDTPWLDAGNFCGSRGQSRRIEGFAARLTGANAANFQISYQCHIAGQGDSQLFLDGQYCGTTSQNRAIESIVVWIKRR